STLVSATAGVAVLRLAAIVPADTAGRAWRSWWVGDLMGALVVTPAIFIWWTRPPLKRRRHRISEAAAAVVAVTVTVVLVFAGHRPIVALHVPAYVLFPVLLVVATRFGLYGAATANLAVAAAAIAFTVLG